MVQPHFIREWRRFRGLTMEELATQISASAAAISRIERGEQRYNQDILERIARALRCRVVDLVSRNPDDESLHDLLDDLPTEVRASFRGMVAAIKSSIDPEPSGVDPVGFNPLEDEREIIGAVLFDHIRNKHLLGVLGRKAFSSVPHQRIWWAMQRLHDEGVIPDPVSVHERVKQSPAPGYERLGGLIYLTEIVSDCPPAALAGGTERAERIFVRWAQNERDGNNEH